jgi:hypothetical protein
LDEIELLEETKDIRDELNILRSIFEEQKDLLQKLFSFIAGSESAPSTGQLSPEKDPVLNYYQERSKIDSKIEKIHKMDKDAKTVYDSVSLSGRSIRVSINQYSSIIFSISSRRTQIYSKP